MTFGKPLRMGTVRWTSHMIRELDLSALPPRLSPPGRAEGLEVESITSGQWLNQLCLGMSPPQKPKRTGLGELLCWWTHQGTGWVAHPGQAWKLHTPSHIPCPVHLFIWPFLSGIPYSKSVTAHKALSWILWAVLANYGIQRGGHRRFLICSQSVSSPGDPDLWLMLEVEAISWDYSPLLLGVCTNSR